MCIGNLSNKLSDTILGLKPRRLDVIEMNKNLSSIFLVFWTKVRHPGIIFNLARSMNPEVAF
jgi:hypothetical protein